MASTDHHIDTRRPRSSGLLADDPSGAFTLAALNGGMAVSALAIALPGAGPVTVALALAFYAIGAAVAGHALGRRYPHGHLGLCNVVTLGRLVLVAALVAPLAAGDGPSWAVFTVAAFALSLDGLDGWLARRQGLVSGFGARFDMEVDAALALVLALNAAVGSEAGVLAVLLGLPRYLFATAGMVLPWMRRDLPERFSRKAVCVLQLGTLIALQAPILPPVLAVLLVPTVASALAWSFVKDMLWLWRRRP